MSTWERIDIYTQADGSAIAEVCTNDNNDDGYPDGETAEWSHAFPSVAAALKHHGRCRVGISGIKVTVYVDGKEVR